MGEPSKTSGDIGEKLATALLDMIGWKLSIHNISIDCNTPSHLQNNGKPRKTHGEDQIFLYNSPFHDDHTEIVHVSVKNNAKKYPQEGTLKTKFKTHLKECPASIIFSGLTSITLAGFS